MENKKFIFSLLLAIVQCSYGMHSDDTNNNQSRANEIKKICIKQIELLEKKRNQKNKRFRSKHYKAQPSNTNPEQLDHTIAWWKNVSENINNPNAKDQDFEYDTPSVYILATLSKIRDNKIVCEQPVANTLKKMLSPEYQKMITLLDTHDKKEKIPTIYSSNSTQTQCSKTTASQQAQLANNRCSLGKKSSSCSTFCSSE